MPSSTYQLRIESIVSSTARMKHALACCGTPATPMLNHTGLLNAARCVTRRYFSSAENASASRLVDEVAAVDAPLRDRVDDAVDDLLQRRLPLGRADRAPEVLLGDDVRGVERPGRRELDVELFEGDRAVCQLVMRASRRSHTTSSYGWTPGDVNCRRRPMRGARAIRSDAIDMVNPPRTKLRSARGLRTAGRKASCDRHSSYSTCRAESRG